MLTVCLSLPGSVPNSKSDQWSSGGRNESSKDGGRWSSHGQGLDSGAVSSRQGDRWPGAVSSQAPDSRSVRPQHGNMGINPPLLQNPPTNVFLGAAATAANIMMGAGLTGGSRQTDVRYDAYSNLGSGSMRRF